MYSNDNYRVMLELAVELEELERQLTNARQRHRSAPAYQVEYTEELLSLSQRMREVAAHMRRLSEYARHHRPTPRSSPGEGLFRESA